MITFETQEDFEDAVMNVLKQRLSIETMVRMERVDDYYSQIEVPVVTVSIHDSDGSLITTHNDKAY